MLKKLFITAVLIGMVLTVISCGNDASTQNNPNKETNSAPETTMSLEDLFPYPAHNFGGEVIKVLALKNGALGEDYEDIYTEQMNGDILNDAVYQRTSVVEEKYNVTIEVTYNGNPTDMTRKNVQADDDVYQFIQDKLMNMLSSLVTPGYLYNLATVDSISLEAPWYNQNAIKDLAINKKVPAIGGDMVVSDKNGIFLMFYNKKIAEDNGIGDLYDLVWNGTWTFSKLHELIKLTSRDLNGDGEMKLADDLWGYMAEPLTGWMFLIAAGNRLADLDSEGLPYITANTPKLISDYDKVMDIMFDKESHVYAPAVQPYVDNFMGNRNFLQSNVMFLLIQFRPKEEDFGIIPFPKLNETQVEYYTPISLYLARFIAMPTTCRDPEMVGAVLDAMFRESTNSIMPAYYETLLENKIARDNESIEMLKIIFNSVVYDIGSGYNWGNMWSMHQKFIMDEKRDYVSTIESALSKIETEMEKTIEEMVKND
ncbi:MAG: hypothetical protein FWF15_00715 [Oscillospiraceae bacterium]|nr:hypothetical protein [Oscillospiraceae bacterium]